MAEDDPVDLLKSTAPTFSIAVPETLKSDTPYAYVLRFGKLDADVENHVSPSEDGGNLTDALPSWNRDGALIYAKDVMTFVAPKIKQLVESNEEWSSDKLEITTAWDNKVAQTAELRFNGGSVGFSIVDKAEVLVGLSSTVISGIESKFVAGFGMASTAGAELKAVVGLKTDLALGLTTEIKGGVVESSVGGGKTSVSENTTHITNGAIKLVAGSPAAQPSTSLTVIAYAMQAANAVALLGTVGTAITGVVTEVQAHDLSSSADTIRTELMAQFGLASSVAGLLAAVELLSVVASIGLKARVAVAPGGTSLELNAGAARLKVGAAAFEFENALASTVRAAEAAVTTAQNQVATAELAYNATIGLPARAAAFTAVGTARTSLLAAKAALQAAISAAAANPVYDGTLNANTVLISSPIKVTLACDPTTYIELTPGKIVLCAAAVEVNASGSFKANALNVAVQPAQPPVPVVVPVPQVAVAAAGGIGGGGAAVGSP